MAGNQGFASMDESKQREIASKGGKASHGGGNKSASTSARGGSSARGAAGKTEAAKRGGQNSHRN